MTLWAFLFSIAFIPGLTGISIPTGWAYLWVTLPFMVWGRVELTLPHILGLTFLAYACVSIAWGPDIYFAFWHLSHLFAMAMAFVLGSRLTSLKPIALGLGLGLWLSSAVSVLRFWAGVPLVLNLPGSPAGLFFNPWVLGAVSALTILLLVEYRLWWPIPGILPGLYLCNSRTALAAVIIPLALRIRHGWIVIALGCAGFAYWSWFWAADSTSIRWGLWKQVVQNLTPFGWGAGAMENAVINLNGQTIFVDYAHSDFLDLAYHYGVFALLPIALVLLLLRNSNVAFQGFLILCLGGFALHTPAPAGLGAMLAGYLSRGWSIPWPSLSLGRLQLLHRPATA